jgi:hypothetical protein
MMILLACAAFVAIWWKLQLSAASKDAFAEPIAEVIPVQLQKETHL